MRLVLCLDSSNWQSNGFVLHRLRVRISLQAPGCEAAQLSRKGFFGFLAPITDIKRFRSNNPTKTSWVRGDRMWSTVKKISLY